MLAKRKTSSDDGEATPTVPEWVTTLARRQFTDNDGEAIGVWFIASKRVENSDLVTQQNRLYLPTDSVAANLVGLLSLEERAMASLVGDTGQPSKRSRTEAEEDEMRKKQKTAGRAHGGLSVRVYARCGFVFYLWLTRWDGSGGTVIKGEELKLFRSFSALKKGDKIDVWAFRRGGELCFAIGRR
ncbi:B3 domain-containing protein At1g05920-like [Zingiber officinale]|nr:B3 domain-containing protein At1g05920-like [Zingiber officinale]